MTPDPDGDRLALRVPGSTARQAELFANAPSDLTVLSVFERRDRTVGVAAGRADQQGSVEGNGGSTRQSAASIGDFADYCDAASACHCDRHGDERSLKSKSGLIIQKGRDDESRPFNVPNDFWLESALRNRPQRWWLLPGFAHAGGHFLGAEVIDRNELEGFPTYSFQQLAFAGADVAFFLGIGEL